MIHLGVLQNLFDTYVVRCTSNMVIHMIHLGVLQNILLYEQHSDTYVHLGVLQNVMCCTSNIVIHMFHLGVLQNVLLYEQHSDTYVPPWCVTKRFVVRAT